MAAGGNNGSKKSAPRLRVGRMSMKAWMLIVGMLICMLFCMLFWTDLASPGSEVSIWFTWAAPSSPFHDRPPDASGDSTGVQPYRRPESVGKSSACSWAPSSVLRSGAWGLGAERPWPTSTHDHGANSLWGAGEGLGVSQRRSQRQIERHPSWLSQTRLRSRLPGRTRARWRARSPKRSEP